MLYEMRTYRLKNGTVPDYLNAVGQEGIQIQKKHLGNLVGYFHSEIGVINQIVHIWAYQDLNDREDRRIRLAADPDWQAFLPRITGLIEVAENTILKPTTFSPLQ